MAFVQLIMKASKLTKLKNELIEEKTDAIKISKKEQTKKKCRHVIINLRLKMRRLFKIVLSCFFFKKLCYTLRHDGSCENFTLKSIVGFISGFILTYIFFMFSVFQLNFTLPTATVFCCILGCILMIGLAFSTKVRCIVLLTLPQFFSQKGRQALVAYAFILAISGPARNITNNMGILSESLACGQEQLKQAVRQIVDVIKKPFLAIRDAIKKVVKTVKEIVKKIKEILLTIKRIIMSILKVIKAVFLFLAKIINICNKELGTPFERCSRVFENAIVDCNAKLGPLFNWLCSLTYIIQSVCYTVKFFDFICIIVDFISDSIVGVVVRKVKAFIRQIRTMFYVRINFTHSFQFQTNTSKTMNEIAHEMMTEVRQRTEVLRAIFKFMTSAAALFFLFIIIRVTYYRFRFLTSEKYDNKYINKDFRELDMRRAKLGKETVLPLNDREMQVYVTVSSKKLAKSEKKALAKAISTLATASVKLSLFMGADYSLFWILGLIQYYGRFQSKVQAPNIPTVNIAGTGFLADMLKSIVKAFQPMGITLEIDTVPCLPTPIPPNYDRYVQIASVILLCWVLTLLEPYGLRLRHIVMCYYHPLRGKQRAIWLYNHIMRSRNTFLKFARRQLRRKIMGDGSIAKVTCKEFLAANFKICSLCLGEGLQSCCLLCGEVFRESDDKKPIKCQTPGCPGIYCEQCFSDLQNLCTICLSPIEYGDLSDISEEKDSSEEEPKTIPSKEVKKKSWKRWFKCSKCCRKFCEDSKKVEVRKSIPRFEKKDDSNEDSSDEEKFLLKDVEEEERAEEEEEDTFKQLPETKDEDLNKTKDSDYYSSDNSTDYSYSYQYEKNYDAQPLPDVTPFKDVEKQELPDYASMSSFREDVGEEVEDKSTAAVEKQCVGTVISGTAFYECKKRRRVDFIGVPDGSRTTIRKKKVKRKRKPRRGEECPLLRHSSSSCTCSDDNDESGGIKHLPSPVLTLLNSSSSLISQNEDFPSSPDLDNRGRIYHSVIGTETRDDLGYAQEFVPELDLTDAEIIHIGEEGSLTSSSAQDPNIKCNHEYVKMMVPELDLSSLTSTPSSSRNYVSDIFGNVKYEEVSESPKSSSSSSIQHSSYMEMSSGHESIPIESILSATRVEEHTQMPSISVIEKEVGTSENPVDIYAFEENQKKKVKQYYKAVKDIPYGIIGEKKKPGKLMKFVQKIIPKRKRNTDAIPLYTKGGKEEVELKTYSTTDDNWNPSSLTTLHSALHRQQGANQENLVSSEEEESDRVRGGESGGIRNFYRSLSRCDTEETSLSGTDTRFLTKYREPSTETKEVLARYFVSIEDLTPTRDCDFPMSSTDPCKTCICSGEEIFVRELPEKDICCKKSPKENTKTCATHISDLHLTAPQLQTSSSSNLSDGFCTSVLGVPCTIEEYKTTSSKSFSLLSKEFLIKGDLSVIPEESDKFRKPSSSGDKISCCTMKEETCCKSQPDLPAANACVSKFCSCESIVNKERVTQTCNSPILKQRQKVSCAPKLTCEKPEKSPVCGRGKVADIIQKCRPREPRKLPRSLSTRDKTQQTCDNFCNEPQLYSRHCCNCHKEDSSHTQYAYSCCKCPASNPGYDQQGAVPRRNCPGYVENYNKYFAEIPSEYSLHSTYRSPDFSSYFTEFPTDTYTSESPRSRQEQRVKSKQKSPRCSCDGDCRCHTKRRKSPQLPMPSQYRCLKFESSTSSDLEDDYDDEESGFHDDRSNRHDLPYQTSDDYLDLVQELEETLQSRNRNRVRRAMQEFERRSKYNKPLEKPIINYDETSESEEPIIQKITQLTSEKRRCSGDDMCNCRKESRMRHTQAKQRSKVKPPPPPCRTPYSTPTDGSKTHWQMDRTSGEWYKVTENQNRFKGRRKSRTPSPRKNCPHNCNCCASKGYKYR